MAREYLIAYQLQGETSWHIDRPLDARTSKRTFEVYANSSPVRRVVRARIEAEFEREPEGREPSER